MRLNDLSKISKSKNSLNSLSPYAGKIRSDLSRYLINKYAIKGECLCDPFCGSGTVLLEGWVKGFNIIGIDLNPYAYTLSMGKLHPFTTLDNAEKRLAIYNNEVKKIIKTTSISDIPKWVNGFFHKKTLKELCAWTTILKEKKEWFLLSCLMGILHHQRPGFLSFPSSHGAPYLRKDKFPKSQFPEMYEYRDVYDRLLKKVKRAYKNFPDLDCSLNRKVYLRDSSKINLSNKRIATIITSPPYMKSLTYARDNRLRLWFLGVRDWKELDKAISPTPIVFLNTMKKCFEKWNKLQIKKDKCIIIIGDIPIKYASKKLSLHEAILDIAKTHYKFVKAFRDPIPEEKKMVKGNENIKREIILVLEKK
jgi:DNA modification methylase